MKKDNRDTYMKKFRLLYRRGFTFTIVYVLANSYFSLLYTDGFPRNTRYGVFNFYIVINKTVAKLTIRFYSKKNADEYVI